MWNMKIISPNPCMNHPVFTNNFFFNKSFSNLLTSSSHYICTNQCLGAYVWRKSVESRHIISKKLKHSHVTTEINYVLQPQLFSWNLPWNILVYPNSSNFIGESSSKLCYFNIRFFDNVKNVYISAVLVHDQQQFKRPVELGIVSTQNTTKYTESK